MDLRVGVSAVVMNWLIMLYFIILFAERVQSIVRSIRDKDVKLFGSGFNSYVYLAVFLSLAAFLVLLAVGNASFLKSLFTMNMNVYRSIDYRMLSITAGVILVSGMVHTEYTIPGIQFASYGMLIAALVIKTACVNAQAEDHVLLWMSLIYLILFSMAIPVMYHSEIESHTLSCDRSGCFTCTCCSVCSLDVQSADRKCSQSILCNSGCHRCNRRYNHRGNALERKGEWLCSDIPDRSVGHVDCRKDRGRGTPAWIGYKSC